MNLKKLLESVNARYLDCGTYSDRGVVYTHEAGKISHTYFQTGFIRNEYLRFDWRRESLPSNMLLWRCVYPIHAQMPWGVQKYDDLATAVAQAIGSSERAAGMLLPMLMPQLRALNDDISRIDTMRHIGTENIENISCYKIAGTRASANDRIWWISADNHAVHRIREDRSSIKEKFSLILECNFSDIEFDGTISPLQDPL